MVWGGASRRRHTRLQGDWSSDVCSSDLRAAGHLHGRRNRDCDQHTICRLAERSDGSAEAARDHVGRSNRRRSDHHTPRPQLRRTRILDDRSEERRVGKECRSWCGEEQAEDGIRDYKVTGVQTCALPIFGLPATYMVGGIATAISTPFVGWLSDRMDRLKLLAIMSGGAIVVVLIITRLGHSSVALASLMMASFMITMSGRFTPAMTMITNAVEGRYRGGFMSVNAALQQAASAGASVLAGQFISVAPDGHLAGMPVLGYVSIAFFILTVLLAAKLRSAAPHVSTPAVKPTLRRPVSEADRKSVV